MDPSTRFIWILVALFFFFIALFFLSGVYYVKKGQVLYLTKKNAFFAKLGPGLYFYLPILFEGFAYENEDEKITYRVHKMTVTIEGHVQDPVSYCSSKANRKKIVKVNLKKEGTFEEKSLQIQHELEFHGWMISHVTIEQ